MKRDGYLTATGTAIAGLLLLMALLLNAHHYLPFLSDDALISLRYAHRLIDGGGLTWNDGERVEGYSNLLWVLASALLGRLGIDLVDAVRALGVLGMGGSVLVLLVAYRRYARRGDFLPLAGAAMLALAAPIAVWTVGGLEQPFVALFLALGIYLVHRAADRDDPQPRDFIIAGLPLALLALTRPDGMLFTAAIALALPVALGWGRRGLVAAFSVAGLPVACYLGQLAFRLGYYGEWVPNTALVKVGFSAGRLLLGGKYVVRGSLPLLPAILPAALLLPGAMRDAAARQRIIITLIPAILWLLYVAAVGGDIFPAGRHMVPFVVLLAFLLSECGVRLAREKRRGSGAVAAGALLLVALCGLIDPKSRKAIDERWEWCGRSIGLALKRGFGDRNPLLAVDAAGCLPYWSELPSVDMLGLNDYYLPRHRPVDFGSGMLGHELGDGRYVMGRRPDLIIFGGPPGDDTAGFRSGREMQAEPGFYRDYSLAIIHADDPLYPCDAHVWVRRNGKLGIDSAGDRIIIPAQLLTGVMVADSSGGFHTELARGINAEAESIPIPPGRWKITVPGADSPGEIYAYAGISNDYRAYTWSDNIIDVPARSHARPPDLYNIMIAGGDGRPVTIRSVELRRQPVPVVE